MAINPFYWGEFTLRFAWRPDKILRYGGGYNHVIDQYHIRLGHGHRCPWELASDLASDLGPCVEMWFIQDVQGSYVACLHSDDGWEQLADLRSMLNRLMPVNMRELLESRYELQPSEGSQRNMVGTL